MTEEGNLGGCPVQQNSRQAGSTKDPVQTYNPQTSDFVFGQERAPGQKIQLSTVRQHSTIPKADYTPDHQPQDTCNWVYPSEQQYFNAIKRKGHKTSERDIPSTLAIHNAVNEQGWAMVKEWEKLRAPGADPKLIRFCGRPQDVSPKAWIKTNLMGYRPPFDRHDWVVEREGREVRYVIDFYSGKPTREKPVALHLDVRPALDSAEAVFDRAHMLYHQDIRPILRGMGRALASGGSGTDQSPPKSSEDAPVPPPSTGVC
ncbi:unnamed protein product [Discosporangium mesarthrocarpum]